MTMKIIVLWGVTPCSLVDRYERLGECPEGGTGFSKTSVPIYQSIRLHIPEDSYLYIKCSVFWDTTACSPARVKRCFRGTYCFNLQGWRAELFFLLPALSWFLTIRPWRRRRVYSCETSVDFHQTIRWYIPEERNVHSHHSGNLKTNSIHIALKFILILVSSSHPHDAPNADTNEVSVSFNVNAERTCLIIISKILHL
jgi:hypothetical protein